MSERLRSYVATACLAQLLGYVFVMMAAVN